jgi:uncharacterized C2H2 Zn-finger protein
MTEPSVTSKWIAAAKILGFDPAALVRCPACSVENLIVQDVSIEGSRQFERIMRCPKCGSQNAILLSK